MKKILIKTIIIIFLFLIIIKTGISTTITDSTGTTVYTIGGDSCNCDSSGEQWICKTAETSTSTFNLPSFEESNGFAPNCRNPGGFVLIGENSCCPSGYTCMNTTIPDSNGQKIGMCNKITYNKCTGMPQSECNNAPENIAEYEVSLKYNNEPGIKCRPETTQSPGFYIKDGSLIDQLCYDYTSNCNCSWNLKNGVWACYASENRQRFCINVSTEPINIGECLNSVSDITNTCEDDGFMTTQVISYWTGEADERPLDCPTDPISIRVPCGSVAKLGFFGFYNFVVSILCIGLVYAGAYLIKKNKMK